VAKRKLAGLNGHQVIKALQRHGFELVRVSGSHYMLRKPGKSLCKVSVPVHGSRDLPPGTVRSIIKQAGLTVEEFTALL
jgi:predicted RNA binding protein YcfA (HicA-like mRNA interferase family)